MRAWLFSAALLLLIGLPPAATAQDEGFDFQSPEALFTKAYRAEFSHDPNKPDLERAIVYYGKALERAKKLLQVENDREEGDRSKIKIEYCIEWAVKSLASRARCREKKTPPEPGDALSDYGEIVSNWKDKAPEKVKDLVELAEIKQTKNGVDIWLSAFAKQVDEWRRGGTMTSKGLEELKNKVWADMGGESEANMKGLILTLDHEEEQVRSVIADKLQLVCNEEGIVMLIERLTDRGYRRGAAVALRAIMERYSRVKEMEDSANKAEFRLKHVPRAGDAPNNKIQEITDIEVNNVRKKAAEERRKLPESIETPRIFEALSKVIIDESLDEGPRTEAIKVLTGFDRLQTEAVDVLLQVLQDPNSRVREAAAQACAKVNTQKSDDKHRLADMLMKLVTYEPVNDTDLEAERMGVEQETHPELQPLLSKLAELMIQRKKDEQEIARRELEVKKLELIRGVQRKQANSDLVREKAAISLGLMGVIKGIPALVDSLDDNSEIVRAAALKALLQICEPLGRVRDMTKELPFKIPYDPMAPRSEESKQALIKALEEQKSKAPSDKPEYGEAIDKRIALLNGARPFTDGQKEWQQWWEATRGVDILVTAFDTFVREWSMYDPKVVYDIQGFKIKIEAEARFSVNPQNERERADAVIKEFHVDSVEFHIVDIVDLVQKAQDPQIAKDVVGWLYKFLDGKVAGRSEVKEVTQIFVGNCLARVIDASKDQEARIKVRNVVQGDVAESPEIKTGATYVCAYYPKDMAEIEAEQNAVAQALRDGNLQVRLAACYASGKIGIARTAKELANKLRDPEKIVRLSAARAIGRIAGDEGQAEKLGQDEIFMANVGERIFDETDDPSKQSAIREPDPEVREEICFAFGFIQHHNAFQFLLRARRDMDDRVRYAAAVANSKIGKKDPQSANMLWSKFYAPEGSLPKFSDREGAILSMGDVNSKDFVGKLCERLVGSGNEPWKTWEPHQRVRRAVALALGEIGHKSPTVRAALEKALLDPAEEVRAASYGSLNKLVAGGLSEVKEDVIFTGKDDSKTQVRVEFMAKLPMDVLKRYHTAIKSWLEVKARDTFKDPD